MQNNPFDIPNMGFNQDNPLFASMNMMRQMWEGMAKNPLDMSNPTAAIPSAEELDKRIKELRAVENWLRLNLSMLNSTIQGLEIQRSTLSTLQSFAQGGLAAMPGLSEAMSQATKIIRPDHTTANPNVELSENPEPASDSDLGAESLAQAGQAWWGLMQQQFETLAQATAQSMQQAQSVAENLSASVQTPSADTTFTKTTAKKAAKATKATKAAKKTTKTAAKKAAKKTSPTK